MESLKILFRHSREASEEKYGEPHVIRFPCLDSNVVPPNTNYMRKRISKLLDWNCFRSLIVVRYFNSMNPTYGRSQKVVH
jgi:hypothetical protein